LIGKYDLHPRFFGKIREMPDGVAMWRNSCARADGQTLSGHLTEGTVLFAGELMLREFLGPDRLRRKDGVTGLNLWI
jgi:hypothetical protein